MKAVLGDMGLEVHRTTDGSTLGADVWGLVLVDALVRCKTAVVGQQHLTDGAGLLISQKRKWDC